jgi:hypothetical protein
LSTVGALLVDKNKRGSLLAALPHRDEPVKVLAVDPQYPRRHGHAPEEPRPEPLLDGPPLHPAVGPGAVEVQESRSERADGRRRRGRSPALLIYVVIYGANSVSLHDARLRVLPRTARTTSEALAGSGQGERLRHGPLPPHQLPPRLYMSAEVRR